VSELLFFGLVDEPNLDRWQAALMRADRSRRPAWGTVRTAVARGCRGKRRLWRHAEGVVGAEVRRAGTRILVTAAESASVTVGNASYRLRAHRTLPIRISGRCTVRLIAAVNPARRSFLLVR
jgi:hypothetical protein